MAYKRRKHTLCFLEYAKNTAAVTLSTEIDVSRIIKSRTAMRRQCQKISYISFFIARISKILLYYPAANALYKSGLFSKIIARNHISAKITMHKMISGSPGVVSIVIPNSHQCTLTQIQAYIEYYKKSIFLTDKAFMPVRILHALPLWLGKILFRQVMRLPEKSTALQGSFSITSLGHRAVDMLIPISGTTLAFGLGQIKDRPVIQDGLIHIKKTVILTMVFDHRVIDGAYASDILTAIKNTVEK